jgi:peptidoglycan/xylan/chitin deacetylase (PgdA/CDA1 family)
VRWQQNWIRRGVPAVTAFLAVALIAGCGTPTPVPVGTPQATAGSAVPSSSAPNGDDGQGATATPSADWQGATAAPGVQPLTAQELAQIPHFPPRPAPHPITVPAGASAGWYSSIPTDQPVAFITIDDGWVKSPQAVQLFHAAHVPVTLFLDIKAIRSDYAYFKPLQQAGAVIEAHTINHIDLKGQPYGVQKQEICGSADQLGQIYGRRPVLFRPPFGDKDANTLLAVHDCGLKAAFFWKEATDDGIVRFQTGHTVKAGDIILMHFRPAFVRDFLAILNAISQAGLTPALLEDYIT